MRHFKIRAGLTPVVDAPPVQVLSGPVTVTRVALMARDIPQMRPDFAVKEGDVVVAGQKLFADRKRPEVAFVAPISGRVTELSYGARRMFRACVIQADGAAPAAETLDIPDHVSRTAICTALQSHGLWWAFRTRPFGLTPDPDSQPAAIVLNAVQGSFAAPDPRVVLADQMDAFQTGVTVLKRLVDGPLFVCQSPGEPLCADHEGVQQVAFSGSAAAGLSGTQIDLLCPATTKRVVWTIGYQDVAAIGHLFEDGTCRSERVIALSGRGFDKPRLVRAPLGVALSDLSGADDRGAVLTGYLGRFADHVISDLVTTTRKPLRWPALASTDAIVPTAAIETALGPRLLPVPLMRALSVGDSEAARDLGCLALIEEDVAALTRLCTSRADYGQLLRWVLDDIRRDVA